MRILDSRALGRALFVLVLVTGPACQLALDFDRSPLNPPPEAGAEEEDTPDTGTSSSKDSGTPTQTDSGSDATTTPDSSIKDATTDG